MSLPQIPDPQYEKPLLIPDASKITERYSKITITVETDREITTVVVPKAIDPVITEAEHSANTELSDGSLLDWIVPAKDVVVTFLALMPDEGTHFAVVTTKQT